LKLYEIGERGVIKMILNFVDEVPPGKNDDAHMFHRRFLLKIDGFALHNSMLPWNTYYDMGWKAITMVTSDLVSKGSKPVVFAASLGINPSDNIENLIEIIKGLRDSAHNYNSKFIGGDINSSQKDVWIDVAGIGELIIKHPIPRKNRIEDGDYVITTGKYGLTSAAFHIYYNNLSWQELMKKYNRIFYSTKRPQVQLSVLNLITELHEYIKVSMDVSDGLAYTLWTLSEINNIAIELKDIPLDEEALDFAQEFRLNPLDLALYGGEEFNIVFIVSSRIESKVLEDITSKYNASIIGKVRKGEGVYYRGKIINRIGWDHFKSTAKNLGD